MPPILNAMEIAKKQLSKYIDSNFIHDKLIFDEGICFDKVILKLLDYENTKDLKDGTTAKTIYDSRKRGTFKKLFHEIDKYRNLWDVNKNIKENLMKIREIIIFSNHVKIIDKLIELTS